MVTFRRHSHCIGAIFEVRDPDIEWQDGSSPLHMPAVPHDVTVLDAAFAAASIGIWECSLPDERLLWSVGVYDMFDLPRSELPQRAETLKCYTASARTELIARRSAAIASCTGFEMDAKIVTFRGRHRWLRITATVEQRHGVPVRIFGIKRDITEERASLERTRYLSEHDALTGLANRFLFTDALQRPFGDDEPAMAFSWLLLIDLDGFKSVNDACGHAVGDRLLKDVASAIAACCGPQELAARIGGDEFAILAVRTRSEVAALADNLVTAIRACGTRGPAIGASIGIAARHDLVDAELVFQEADAALYAAKSGGRNTWRMAGVIA
ncbi:diguanylate cyclase [Aureimonas altamirensis]|uniref:diguanylate cyclase domain-containing protein n=1 Tax=Aureimonas altamirensis TaxID=370622 RepID=UPI001E4A57BE|nr:diguanylate cyclase [Aureimonas altamirensis]UHD46725.1 diguanylate cyclase [Aureimonas altamirensis]